MNAKDKEQLHQQLITSKDELLTLSSVDEEFTKTVELDQSSVGRLSRMDAMQGQKMAQEASRRRVEKLKAIEMALARLSKSDFGDCANCHEPIDLRRLQFDPTMTLCVSCA